VTAPVVTVKDGRRWSDWHIVESSGRSIFYYVLGMFLDETGKPSMARWMLLLWTYTGWLMIRHELGLKVGDPSIQNAVWQSWWAAEGFIGLAVFGPRIASYFGAGAAGAVTGIGASIRDGLAKIGEQIEAKTSPANPTVTNTTTTITAPPPAPAPTPAPTPPPTEPGETPVPESLAGKG
jgi:hypothetical protein